MTSQTSRNTGWRRAAVGAVASGALAAGSMAGIGLANAEPAAPADPTTGTDAPPPMTADQAIAIIATEYDTGAGGGQLSTPGPPGPEASFGRASTRRRATGTTSWPRWISGRTRRH